MRRQNLYLLLLILIFLLTGCSGNGSWEKKDKAAQKISGIQRDASISESGKASEKEGDDEGKKHHVSDETADEATETEEQTAEDLSESEVENIKQAAYRYYSSIGLTVIQMVQIEKDPSVINESENTFGEIAVFEVVVENDEEKRYIVVGSNNHWKDCNVVNEGY